MRGLIVMMVLALILSSPSSLAISGANDTQELTAQSAPITGSIIPSQYTGSAIAVVLVNMTPIDTREIGRGAECPRGSGRYCSSSIPYCCRSSSGTPYCASNSNGCTR